MVVVIHPWITGNETTGYWQAFIQFLDRIENKNIDIVKTSELLEFYIEDDEPENYLDVLWIDSQTNPFFKSAGV